ncbi:hypothetical protein GLOIN_2v1673942 [Rhizophagus irregularis DAOM 181602=DAOM 197198]|nr:hypothetical protein GLOIN_2v1673942 [Rhizophagus irregularis DAOM 181602=DAOM 197198]
MSGNYAKRGCGSHNPNSRKASRQERKNNNNSDNSSSDGENTIQLKRNRTITENSMEEDYVADAQTADVGVDGPSSSPQQNISGENTLTSSPNKSAAPTALSHVASSGNVDASMHAPSNKDLQQPSNASPNLDTNGAPDGDHTPDPVVTLAITRDDFQAAAAPNAAPEFLKKFPTNKALIEAVNNLFLETYESFTGKARMTGSGEAKRLVIHFHTAEARDLSPGYPSYRYPFFLSKRITSWPISKNLVTLPLAASSPGLMPKSSKPVLFMITPIQLLVLPINWLYTVSPPVLELLHVSILWIKRLCAVNTLPPSLNFLPMLRISTWLLSHVTLAQRLSMSRSL